jgi:cobalt-zinc-cadmium efflux system outer membrane protein
VLLARARRTLCTLQIPLALVSIATPTALRAQPDEADTVRVTIDQLEARFLERNLELLAARFNVSAAAAMVEQARLWPNPNLEIEQGVYDGSSRGPVGFTRSGSTDIQLQQLIQLAGKRNKQVRLARVEREIAEHSLTDLVRTLRYELRSAFFNLYFLQRAVAFDDRTIAEVGRTIAVAEKLYERRTILFSEVVRLRALLLSVQSERLGHLNQIAELQGNLRVLLRDEGLPQRYYVPTLDRSRLDSLHVDTIALGAIVARAREARPDARIAESNARLEEANLSLQRALRTPDLTLGASYSSTGGPAPRYFALGVGIELPLFDRNQGNIRASAYTLAASRRTAESARAGVERDVLAAYRKAADADMLFHGLDRRFVDDYDRLAAATVTNYERRNINIIEFTDFFDSYRQAMQELNQLEMGRADALEALNFAVGAPVVRP